MHGWTLSRVHNIRWIERNLNWSITVEIYTAHNLLKRFQKVILAT